MNFGDPIWPAPTEITLPRLAQIGQQPIHLLGYPLPMVIAEKTVTAVQRGEANTRWRDFADILTISRFHTFSAGELSAALGTVATYRAVTLRPLLPMLAAMPDVAQIKWARWRRRQTHALLPDHFSDVLGAVAKFTEPVMDSVVSDNTRWNPTRQIWEQQLL